MPYRLFKPVGKLPAKLPLVVYLHGAGGLGTDNRKQITGGNQFGTHVWILPDNQRRFPCLVLAPQTFRGWANYRLPTTAGERPVLLPGLGEGARLLFEIIDVLRKELPVDDSRIYVTGQSMGGMGTWHAISERPNLFAAAAPVCGAGDPQAIAAARNVPVWNFHGIDDPTVPVDRSRTLIDALRKAGGRPLHTEYPGVGHNSWEWAYTEPALPEWLFGHKR
jgi:predicted peptidase